MSNYFIVSVLLLVYRGNGNAVLVSRRYPNDKYPSDMLPEVRLRKGSAPHEAAVADFEKSTGLTLGNLAYRDAFIRGGTGLVLVCTSSLTDGTEVVSRYPQEELYEWLSKEQLLGMSDRYANYGHAMEHWPFADDKC
ncbi:hypothetical protein [Crystallibacter degradans]|uniref:hypothetical protein n=1 Tax=Crystallibacter degradans TaxID=2726743 RepID=UPI0014749545|nr:hypothetical protein [Arthrobacter sp. SF27]NMR28579.1 hypothetical protein [Arthrobacter sp. SF27]